MLKGIVNFINGVDEKKLKQFPTIDTLFEECEKNPHKINEVALHDSLTEIFKKISQATESEGLKKFSIKEIFDYSHLYAHQVKHEIIHSLIELGFDTKVELRPSIIRFGKKIDDSFVFLNLNEQSPLPTSVKTVVDNSIDLITESFLTKIPFGTVVTIGSNRILVTYDLILGCAKLKKTA